MGEVCYNSKLFLGCMEQQEAGNVNLEQVINRLFCLRH